MKSTGRSSTNSLIYSFTHLLLFFFSLSLSAQTDSSGLRKVTRLLEVGLSANGYRGDLAAKYQKWSASVQLGMKLNFKKRVNSHFNLGIGSVTGQNPDYTFTINAQETATPNQFFKTSYVSLNYDLQVNLLKTRHWTVYLSQGLGLIRFRAKDENNVLLASRFDTRPENETYNTITLMLPTQAGAIYQFTNGYGIGVQGGWLNPQTDYLDNISQWGNRSKKDNVLSFRFSFLAPLTFEK